jgi:hypothetical protein
MVSHPYYCEATGNCNVFLPVISIDTYLKRIKVDRNITSKICTVMSDIKYVSYKICRYVYDTPSFQTPHV